MDLDPRRKPVYDLFASVIQKLKQGHLEAIEEVIRVFPEATSEVQGYHEVYCSRLDSLLKASRVPATQDDEPLWNLLMVLGTPPNFDEPNPSRQVVLVS